MVSIDFWIKYSYKNKEVRATEKYKYKSYQSL